MLTFEVKFNKIEFEVKSQQVEERTRKRLEFRELHATKN